MNHFQEIIKFAKATKADVDSKGRLFITFDDSLKSIIVDYDTKTEEILYLNVLHDAKEHVFSKYESVSPNKRVIFHDSIEEVLEIMKADEENFLILND